ADDGTIAFLPIDQDAATIVRDVFDAWRVRQPAEIWRRPVTYDQDLGLSGATWGDPWKGFLVVHRDASGTVDGYARYRVEAKWEHRQPASRLLVDEIHGLTDKATLALLRFLVDVDLVTSIRIERRTPTDRLPWLLTNARAAETEDVG